MGRISPCKNTVLAVRYMNPRLWHLFSLPLCCSMHSNTLQTRDLSLSPVYSIHYGKLWGNLIVDPILQGFCPPSTTKQKLKQQVSSEHAVRCAVCSTFRGFLEGSSEINDMRLYPKSRMEFCETVRGWFVKIRLECTSNSSPNRRSCKRYL
jgi:hypothetical protein